MTWDGKERRQDKREDGREEREMLIRIDVNLSNFMSRFDKHVEEDAVNFKELRDGMDTLKRYVYIGMGGVIVLEFIFKLMK